MIWSPNMLTAWLRPWYGLREMYGTKAWATLSLKITYNCKVDAAIYPTATSTHSIKKGCAEAVVSVTHE